MHAFARKPLLKILAAFAFALAVTGCLTDSKDGDKGEAPVIASHSGDTTVSEGGTATFRVTATGSAPLTYTWVRDGADTLSSHAPTLTLTNVSLAASGTNYLCIVSNASGAAVTSPMILTVEAVAGTPSAPVITQQPSNQTIEYGDEVTFTVTATGSAPLRYTWVTTEGDTLQDSTLATLTGFPGASDSGLSVRVIVRNALGSVTSNSATLTIIGTTPMPAAEVVTVGGNGHLTLGSAVDLDSAKVLTSTQVIANNYAALPRVDLVLLHYAGALSLNGTKAARDSGIKYSINLTNGYPQLLAKEIKILPVTSRPGNQELAVETWDFADAEELVESIQVSAGKKFLMETAQGRLVYVEVASVTGATGSDAATLNLFITEYVYE
jgi:predicted RNA-binding protein with TRAM domain